MLFMILRGLAVATGGVLFCMLGMAVGGVYGLLLAMVIYVVTVLWIGVERIVREVRRLTAKAVVPGSTAEPGE